jgi:hypothetical protein
MNPLTIKIVAYAAGALFLFSAGFGFEYRNMVAYKAEQKGITEAQVTEVKRLNTLIDTNAKDANESLSSSIQNIHAYYKSNPVIRMQNNGSCSVSQGTPGSTSSDATTTSLYASPYTPESTELVANQLDLLIKLLYNDGVEIK